MYCLNYRDIDLLSVQVFMLTCLQHKVLMITDRKFYRTTSCNSLCIHAHRVGRPWHKRDNAIFLSYIIHSQNTDVMWCHMVKLVEDPTDSEDIECFVFVCMQSKMMRDKAAGEGRFIITSSPRLFSLFSSCPSSSFVCPPSISFSESISETTGGGRRSWRRGSRLDFSLFPKSLFCSRRDS